MHIKTLTIQGFKSYRDQTAIEPFSPGHNVVVGRNGSGKSNFFAAIRFVLSDAYTSMSREERQSLLHEGPSMHTTLSAYVEIVFDNTDGRFPTGNNEVVLRRTIGLKKDEYSLDRKSASKADVMNLLESAGFSKSNPYYIVPQGRITSLTNAKDSERLNLLKEVAGTKVYEQRRTESLRLMEETDTKRSKISELLEFIEQRLAELEEEKEELKEFQAKDRERRCLEYALYSRESEDVNQALQDLEDERRTEAADAKERRQEYSARERQLEQLEANLTAARYKLSLLESTKASLRDELTESVRNRTELSCIVDDLKAAGERSEERRDELQEALTEIEEKITEKEAELEDLLPQFQQITQRERAAKTELEDASARLQALYSKQGRLSAYKTKAERDAALRKEIASINAYLASQTSALEQANLDLNALTEQADGKKERAERLRAQVDEERETQKGWTEELRELEEKQARWREDLKDLWKEDSRLGVTVQREKDDLQVAERALASMMDRDTANGLKAVDSIAQRLKLTGVYGPLYRLFEVTDPVTYNTAVEVTARNSLFHVVVDNDETARKVVEVMNKERTGRLTFVPLSKLKTKHINYPPPDPNGPQKLIDKLKFDANLSPAFEQVFGKTLVCRNLESGSAYVRQYDLNVITTDGDRIDRKGALTGGYVDIRKSRLEAIKTVKTRKTKFEQDSKAFTEGKKAITVLEQKRTEVAGQIELLKRRRANAGGAWGQLMQESILLERDEEVLRGRINKMQGEIRDLEADIRTNTVRKAEDERELRSPMTRTLSDEEQQAVETVGKQCERLQKSIGEISKDKMDIESKVSLSKVELNEGLRRRREDIRAQLEAIGDVDAGDNAGDDLVSRAHELEGLNRMIENLTFQSKANETELESQQSKIQTTVDQIEKLQLKQTEEGRALSKQQKGTERYVSKRQLLVQRKDECTKQIRDLGVLPEEAFEKYINVKSERLAKQLKTVNEGLKKFQHVNKKAFEQYNNFTTQRDKLIQRREDLDKSAASIEELVQVLDQRKEEAIERTFKQVSKFFEEVFEKLVPVGRGRLIMQKRIDQDEDDQEDDDEGAHPSAIDNYTGVSIKVSFNSKHDEGLRIQQLSGGQKSLVALATVFAIQKCDPAPFYLFDEIDANLDAQYRTAVASMIHELSESAQFITTTFRPEMLAQADKFYGVVFDAQKVSTVRSISRDEAQMFVEREAQAQ
ncbi:RecF/RecN/SMC protein [Dacryopinax primogenitus]|uniref:Structural maintenance of chromosomes protein n=1 Tax=Dacryopinax primogenitus (strain DJM 731) TaxID=1858805 RepID=M5FPF7_DACPD|nr:RecF/RecN/SMC protein [Dacryopinax primogenitus]EJT97043.1 RecF/RecN/SMC protein [Dacryopinax primogenitus]